MRLIDADALECDTEWSEYEDDFISYSKMEIACAPTIDAVSVVRCKECKWDKAQMIPKEVKCIYQHNADDFCSYGVHKTNTTAEEKPTPIRDYMVHGERREP